MVSLTNSSSTRAIPSIRMKLGTSIVAAIGNGRASRLNKSCSRLAYSGARKSHRSLRSGSHPRTTGDSEIVISSIDRGDRIVTAHVRPPWSSILAKIAGLLAVENSSASPAILPIDIGPRRYRTDRPPVLFIYYQGSQHAPCSLASRRSSATAL